MVSPLTQEHPCTTSDDGIFSTLLECDFSNPSFRQCNLSRVSGYNVGMSFSFDAGDCGGNSWCAFCLTHRRAMI
jgi:hypothetical protein